MSDVKRLVRSKNKMIAGVCAGIAEYLAIDTAIVRIVWLLLTIFGGAGLVAYIVCLLLMPNE